jgi:hypothetical protein
MAEMGFYVHQIAAMFFEERKKDFAVMLTHHFTTLALCFCSWTQGFSAIGAVILFLHDISDPFLSAAKVIHYIKQENISQGVFVLFTLSFAYTRLYLFPVVCIASVYNEPLKLFPQGHDMWAVFLALLVTLFFMHCYWFYLVLRMAFALLCKSEWKGDERSDNDTSEDEATASSSPASSKRK